MPDLSSLPITIPMMFLVFQGAVIGFFVLYHFLLGVKRGVKKTLFYFIGHIGLVLLLFWFIGFFTVAWVFTEENLRAWFGAFALGEQTGNDYIDMVIQANALPLVLAIIDLVVKIVLFIVLYVLLRWFLTLVLYAWIWRFFKPDPDEDIRKHRFIGGLIGVARGAFAGFIIILPVLILLNTIIGQGIEIDDPEYRELAIEISEANTYNFVNYVNMVQIGQSGAADFLFDMAFRSQLSGSTDVIIWRAELDWIAEFARVAAPFVLPGDGAEVSTGEEGFSLDYESFQTFRGAFDKLMDSMLLDTSLTPALVFGVDLLGEQYPDIPLDTINYIKNQIGDLDVSLTGDLNTIFDAVSELLSIQDLDAWMVTFEDPASVLGFDEDSQTHLKNAISDLTGLSIFAISDYALEAALYLPEFQSQITWVADEDKAAFVGAIRDKIRNFSSETSSSLLGTTLIELGDLISTIAFDFPGVTIGDTTYDLVSFVNQIGDLMIVLNDDPDYHSWFHDTIIELADLSLFTTFLPEIVSFGANSIALDDSWTSEEIALIRTIIESNFADHDALKDQLTWVADVYEAIGNFGVGPMFAADANQIEVFDDIMKTTGGPEAFNALIDTILDGQLINDITNQMSSVLVSKFVTDPLLLDPLDKLATIDSFSYIEEVRTLANVIGRLYEVESFSLASALEEGADPIDVLLPAMVEFASSEANRNTLLSSDILYAVIDVQLSNLEAFALPDVVKEPTGSYEGWVKRSELSILLEVFAALELTTIPTDDAGMEALIGQIAGFAADEVNRNLIMSSDIIYFVVSDQLLNLEVDLFTIPTQILESSGDYEGWVKRTEISTILEIFGALGISSIPSGEDAVNELIAEVLSFTQTEINRNLILSSDLIYFMISDQIINMDVEGFEIPTNALETDGDYQNWVKRSEVSKMLEVIAILEITELPGAEGFDLTTITSSQLSQVIELDSLILTRLITTELKATDIVTLPFAAFRDGEENDLTLEELQAIAQLLEDLNLDLSVLLDNSGDTETLLSSIYVYQLINLEYETSYVIRSFITYGITTALQTTNLHPLAVDSEYPDMLSVEEIGALLEALEILDETGDQTLNDLSASLTPESMNVSQLSSVITVGSILITEQVTTAVEASFEIHASVIDVRTNDPEIPNLIVEDELVRLKDVILIIDDGNNQSLNELLDLLDPRTLSFIQMNAVIAVDSIIIRGAITTNIDEVELINTLDLTTDIYEDNDPQSGLLTKIELSNLVAALTYLAADPSDAVLPVVETLDPLLLSLGTLENMVTEQSVILRILMSDQLKDTDGFVIHPDALDSNDHVTQTELEALFVAFSFSLGADLEIGDLSNLTETVTIGQMMLLDSQSSLIKDGMISKLLVDNIPGGKTAIRTHAYDAQDLLKAEPFGLLDQAEISRMFNALYALSGNDDDAILMNLTSDISDTSTITLDQVTSIVSESSIIINSMVSENLIPSITLEKIHPDALEENSTPGEVLLTTEIKRPEMIDLMLALSTSLGGNKTVDDLTTISEDITIGQIMLLDEQTSLIKDGLISKMIVENLPGEENSVRTHAYDAMDLAKPEPFGLLDQAEISRMFEALYALSGNDDLAVLKDLTASLANTSTITLNEINQVVQADSIVINSVISENMIPSLTLAKIHPDALEANSTPNTVLLTTEIKRPEMKDLITALEASLGGSKTVDDLTNLQEVITIGEIMLLDGQTSLIKDGLISKMIVESVPGGVNTVRTHAYDATDLAKPEPFGLLEQAEITRMFNALYVLANQDDQALLKDLTESLSDTSTITLGQVSDVVSPESIIINSIISENMIPILTINRIHPDALEDNQTPNALVNTTEIIRSDMKALMIALENALGSSKTLDQLENLSTEITIGEIMLLDAETSLIKDGLISKMIVENLPGGASAVRTHAYDALDIAKPQPFGLLDATEISRVFGSLYELSNQNDSALLSELIAALSDTTSITIGQVTDAVSLESIIINSIISENLIPILVLSDIHPDTLEDNETPDTLVLTTEIKRPDMIDLFNAFETLGSNVTLSALETLLGDSLTIQDIQTMRTKESKIFEGKVSKIIEATVTPTRIIDEAYVIGDTFGLIDPLEITRLLDALDAFSGGGAVGAASTQLGTGAANLKIETLETIHGFESLIIRYYISEGLLSFVDNDVNDAAYEVNYIGTYYTYDEISYIIDSLKVLSGNDLDQELQTLITNMNPATLEPTMLLDLFNETGYSYVMQREVSKVINAIDFTTAFGINIPESSYVGNDSTNIDLKDSELRAIADALDALGVTTLQMDQIDAGSTSLAQIKLAVAADSKLVNRIISKSIVDANLDTIESHVGQEDPSVDIQVDEIINMVDAFVAMGITDINGASSTNPVVLITNAQAIDRTEFRGYIDYDELDEDAGMTMVKEFLYDMLGSTYSTYTFGDTLDTRVKLDAFIYDIM